MNLLERAKSFGIEGFMHCAELDKLAELATGKDVLEIGAYKGLTAWGMAQTARSVTSIDTFKATTDGQRQLNDLTTLDDYNRAVAGLENVRPPIVSPSCVAEVDGDFDLIFIDAMHSYEEIKPDIERWWPRVRSGGLLVLHDYRHIHFAGVEQAADELFGPAKGENIDICYSLRWILKP